MNRSAIIKALGGYTKLEYENLDKTLESWRTRCTASETTVELFKDIVSRERERSDKIMERLFPDKSQQQQQPPEMKPVGNSVSSWPRIRRELEKLDREKSNAQVSRGEIEKEIREG